MQNKQKETCVGPCQKDMSIIFLFFGVLVAYVEMSSVERSLDHPYVLSFHWRKFNLSVCMCGPANRIGLWLSLAHYEHPWWRFHLTQNDAKVDVEIDASVDPKWTESSKNDESVLQIKNELLPPRTVFFPGNVHTCVLMAQTWIYTQMGSTGMGLVKEHLQRIVKWWVRISLFPCVQNTQTFSTVNSKIIGPKLKYG